jgi:hypothetical protein
MCQLMLLVVWTVFSCFSSLQTVRISSYYTKFSLYFYLGFLVLFMLSLVKSGTVMSRFAKNCTSRAPRYVDYTINCRFESIFLTFELKSAAHSMNHRMWRHNTTILKSPLISKNIHSHIRRPRSISTTLKKVFSQPS